MELKVIHNTRFHWFALISLIFQWFNATVPANEEYFCITQDETKAEVNWDFMKTFCGSFPAGVIASIFKKIIGLGGPVFERKAIRVLRITKDFWTFKKNLGLTFTKHIYPTEKLLSF